MDAKAARRPRPRPVALPSDPPGAEPSGSSDQYLQPAPARLPPATGLQAQEILRLCAWGPGAQCPRPAQRRWRRARRLMLQGKPKAREPRRRRDLARVKCLSPERSVRATSQPVAPPSLPASRPGPRSPCAPPRCCGGRFPGTFQEFTPRDRGPRYCFKKAGALLRRLQGRRAQSAWVLGSVLWLPRNPPSSDPTLGSAPRRAGEAPGHHRPRFGWRSLTP